MRRGPRGMLPGDWFEIVIDRFRDGDSFLGISLDMYDSEFEGRLFGVDAPEIGGSGPLADVAEDALLYVNGLGEFGKDVFLFEYVEMDRWDRWVGVLSRPGDSESVNLQLLRFGLAWLLTTYGVLPGGEEAEREARESKIGLWSFDK